VHSIVRCKVTTYFRMAEVSRGETYQTDALNPSAEPSLDNTSEGKRTCEINKIMQNILQTVVADAACRSVHVSPLTAVPSRLLQSATHHDQLTHSRCDVRRDRLSPYA
jgi:hypothetical protein